MTLRNILTAVIIFIVAMVIAIAVYAAFFAPKSNQEAPLMIINQTVIRQEQACVDSGGMAGMAFCCNLAGDFPDMCNVGTCGCSMANSHQVKVCNCPEGKCFNGSLCVAGQQAMMDAYCVSDNCKLKQVIMGAGTLVQGCYRSAAGCIDAIKTICISDAECLGDTCCHPQSCVNRAYRGDCSQEVCTLSCQGPLDCGAGSCVCVNNQCTVVPATAK